MAATGKKRTAAASATAPVTVPRARTSEEEAVRLWREMTSGRVGVKRHYDEGGRRYLVLEPLNYTEQVAQLTERERQAVGYRAYGQGLKRIADELGVSQPTVARALASARKKLGVASDLDLPAIFAAGLRRPR